MRITSRGSEMTTNDLENSSRITSPRFTEECRRYRGGESDSLGRSEKSLLGKEVPSIWKERHELLLEKEMSKIARKEELAHSAAPRLRASTSPDGDQPGLETETQRLATLERRQAMELKQMLSYELQHFWREERDRRILEKSAEQDAAIEAKRQDKLLAAYQARQERDKESVWRVQEAEQAAADNRTRQEDAVRRLEAKNRFRWRQVERQAQQRIVEAGKKAAILQNRIARSACSRRARQLRDERLAVKNADEWETATETARRTREANYEARETAVAARMEAMRTTFDKVCRNQGNETKHNTWTERKGKVADLETRMKSFHKRQKVTAERERFLKGEDIEEKERRKLEAFRRMLLCDEKKTAHWLEGIEQRDKKAAQALKIRMEKTAAKLQKDRRDKEEQTRKVLERRRKIDEKRRWATKRKLTDNAAKAELLQSRKKEILAACNKLSSETANQREALKRHLETMKDTSQRCINFEAIAAAVSAAASEQDYTSSLNSARRSIIPTTAGRLKESKGYDGNHRSGESNVSSLANNGIRAADIGDDVDRGQHQQCCRSTQTPVLSASVINRPAIVSSRARPNSVVCERRMREFFSAYMPQAPTVPQSHARSLSLRSRSAGIRRPQGKGLGFRSSEGIMDKRLARYSTQTVQKCRGECFVMHFGGGGNLITHVPGVQALRGQRPCGASHKGQVTIKAP